MYFGDFNTVKQKKKQKAKINEGAKSMSNVVSIIMSSWKLVRA